MVLTYFPFEHFAVHITPFPYNYFFFPFPVSYIYAWLVSPFTFPSSLLITIRVASFLPSFL